MRFELTRRNRHYPLKVACLPIPPPGQKNRQNHGSASFDLSEKRDSNPRPRPWQGRALPTELFSQLCQSQILVSHNRSCQGRNSFPVFCGKVVLYQLSYFRILLSHPLFRFCVAKVSLFFIPNNRVRSFFCFSSVGFFLFVSNSLSCRCLDFRIFF